MSTTLGLKVETDDSIRHYLGLSEAVESASQFLKTHILNAKLPDLNDLLLSWRYLDFDGGRVEASLRAWWEFDTVGQGVRPFRLIPVRNLFDPISSKVWMWRLWGDVLEQASRMKLLHIDEQIQELEKVEREEEANAR